ncbi:hypothetical protein [Elizabethkingia sp. M8]|uniref:hypothetical protein n=1 Tax=Elizabethkingia sp. M8 TaxID=2796140 RepID=UPI0019077C0C|nr:hypothetical protein [Elizabethkingia sp. M8]QQM28268.1 hypothetical protein JCR23_07615 [Elizabethkingia sp. M8]
MNNKEIFVYYSSPENWFQTALELNETINELFIIKEKSHYIDTYHLHTKRFKRSFCSKSIYLLMSFSIENLIKGLLILRNPEYVNTGTLKKEIKTHDLINLVDQANLKLLVRETILLKKLTQISVSTARYPVGLNEHLQIFPVEIIEKDEIIYKKFFIKLRNKLAKEFNKHGWFSGLDNPKLRTEPGEFKFFENYNPMLE